VDLEALKASKAESDAEAQRLKGERDALSSANSDGDAALAKLQKELDDCHRAAADAQVLGSVARVLANQQSCGLFPGSYFFQMCVAT
jgi:hypothetical protein